MEKDFSVIINDTNKRILFELENIQDRLDNGTFSHFDELFLILISSYNNTLKHILEES